MDKHVLDNIEKKNDFFGFEPITNMIEGTQHINHFFLDIIAYDFISKKATINICF